MKINYIDLFSGIGGFHEGLRQAGFKFEWIGYSEIDKYAIQIYKNHFKDSKYLGNVNGIFQKDISKKIDLITFGFPCQDLSVAGKRKGIKADRSGLFFEAMRIIRITKPRYFIFENVKGLFSSNEGKDWLTILREIADSGYDGQWQVLNTRWFLPQNRERVYFVGHIREERRPQVFPIGEGIATTDNSKSRRIWYSTLCAFWGDRGKGRIPAILRNGRWIVVTPKECERLQGFKDDWTKYGNNDELISDLQRYKCIGNAVSIPVVKEIGKRLLKSFKERSLSEKKKKYKGR